MRALAFLPLNNIHVIIMQHKHTDRKQYHCTFYGYHIGKNQDLLSEPQGVYHCADLSFLYVNMKGAVCCLLYTSDAADEL